MGVTIIIMECTTNTCIGYLENPYRELGLNSTYNIPKGDHQTFLSVPTSSVLTDQTDGH